MVLPVQFGVHIYSKISYSVTALYLCPIHFDFLLGWFSVRLPIEYDHHCFLWAAPQSLFVTPSDTSFNRSLHALPCSFRLIRRSYQASVVCIPIGISTRPLSNFFSRASNARFHSIGGRTPPCGVPLVNNLWLVLVPYSTDDILFFRY